MANAQYFQWPADSRQRSASLVCVKTKRSNEWWVTIGHWLDPALHCVLCWWKLRESAGDQHNALLSLMGNVDVVLAAVPGWAPVAKQKQYWCCSWKMCGNPLNTWGRLYFGGSKLVLLHITFWITQNHLVHNWAWGLQSMFLNDR